jgi:hypothetical protein
MESHMFIGILIDIGRLIESFTSGIITRLFLLFFVICTIKWGG